MKIELDKIDLKPKTLEDALELIGQLVVIILDLKKENESLREQLNNNSNNSSLPPSQDKKKKPSKKAKTGRTRGGQPGHQARQRIVAPEERVDKFIYCKPPEVCECGGRIKLHDAVRKHQVFEIPVARYHVAEYRLYKGCCEACRQSHHGQLPAGVSWKGFGVRAQAMVSLLTSKYRLSKRLATNWFKDVYGMPMCLGSVSNVEHTVSRALEKTHEDVFKQVRQEKVNHVDETSHKECSKNGWAWILSTKSCTYFRLTGSRGKKIAKELIGAVEGRVIVSDRYGAYDYLPVANHQVCWAHLKRDFQKIAERAGAAGEVGRTLLKTYEQLFGFWKTEHDIADTVNKKKKRRLKYLKRKLLKTLRRGVTCGHAKTERTCENISDCAGSLWRFFEVEGVPPTNNQAERQLRPLVISKKLTFGTQSERGSRFIERIFTAVTTCAQQQRDICTFLSERVFIKLCHPFFITQYLIDLRSKCQAVKSFRPIRAQAYSISF